MSCLSHHFQTGQYSTINTAIAYYNGVKPTKSYRFENDWVGSMDEIYVLSDQRIKKSM